MDAGVLHLDRDVTTVTGDGAMDLADAGSGSRHVGPVEERTLRWFAEFVGDDAGGERRRHRRGVGLERRERCLGILGQRLEDEADHLAGLHQDALHLAELFRDILRGPDRELRVELGSALGG